MKGRWSERKKDRRTSLRIRREMSREFSVAVGGVADVGGGGSDGGMVGGGVAHGGGEVAGADEEHVWIFGRGGVSSVLIRSFAGMRSERATG